MAPVAPRCVNCKNFSGCQGEAGVCRVWQVLLPAPLAASGRCPFWTHPGKG
jgi:hypothetical protein